MSQNCTCTTGTIVPLTGLGLGMDLSSIAPIDYSFEEQWTGMRWVDGKKIYQKTMFFGDLPNSGARDVPHNVANIDKVIRFWGCMERPDEAPEIRSCHPIPFVHNPEWTISCNINRSYARIRTFMDSSAYSDSLLTFQYTCTDR